MGKKWAEAGLFYLTAQPEKRGLGDRGRGLAQAKLLLPTAPGGKSHQDP